MKNYCEKVHKREEKKILKRLEKVCDEMIRKKTKNTIEINKLPTVLLFYLVQVSVSM